MTNRLANENSPYLLQHAENPVHWYPWGEAALERARQEDKPIFLSIGYAACHWCHVMAHESFEDPQTAAIMNENFINIKVDREERPDLDNIYMTAVVAMTGQGGWPMSVFLTPEGEPFYGGTYFPPVRRYGMPSFRDVLLSLAHSWKEDRERLLQAGQEVAQHIKQSAVLPGAAAATEQPDFDTKLLDEAAMRLAQAYDWKFGGWGSAPKFPQPMAIEFLLRRAARGDKMALEMATHALDSMALGGMYDVVGGGFARYSTDDYWRVPHFEKMLYDNGQLARVYLYGYLLTGVDRYRQVCEETLDFIRRELMHASDEPEDWRGGIFSSLDADSEGEEGKFYVWTPAEIRAAIPIPEDVEFLMAAYGVTEAGNFEGKNVLQRVADDGELAEQFKMPVEGVNGRLKDLHAQLLAARSSRIRPGTDDKVLVAWNALALEAFAEAGRYLQRSDYLEVARLNADFILTELNGRGEPAERLLRSWRNGKALHNAYLEDYAGLILGLLALYQSDPDPYWFRSAVQLAEELVAHFTDPNGGFYDTRDDHEPLLTRPKDIEDNATPSGNALAAVALLYLSAYTGRGEWRDLAERSIAAIQPLAGRYPTAFGKWLCAMDFAAGPSYEVAILSQPDDPALSSFVDILWSRFRPQLLAAVSEFPPPTTAPALLNDRPLIDGKPTAYVCQNFTCNRPTADPAELQAQLEPKPSRSS